MVSDARKPGLRGAGGVTAATMPHPPFAAGPASSAKDFMTEAGAQELARRIREAWARCGHDVAPVVEPALGAKGMGVIHVVRLPGLVRGLPAPRA